MILVPLFIILAYPELAETAGCAAGCTCSIGSELTCNVNSLRSGAEVSVNPDVVEGLGSIPAGSINVSGLPVIAELWIDNNPLLKTISLDLSESFSNLTSLYIMFNVNLTHITTDIKANYILLTGITISSNNKLSHLNMSAWYTPELTEFTLSDNNLTYLLLDTFNDKPKLTAVYLDGNQLTHITSYLISPLQYWTDVVILFSVEKNPLRCDCRNAYLRNLIYHRPNISNGVQFYNINPDDLVTCDSSTSSILDYKISSCSAQLTNGCTNRTRVESFDISTLCGCEPCQPCDYTRDCLINQCDGVTCMNEGYCQYNIVNKKHECVCIEDYGGVDCRYRTSCDYIKCDDPDQYCVINNSTIRPTCKEDNVISRFRYGSQSIIPCTNNEKCQIPLDHSVCKNGNCQCEYGRFAYQDECIKLWVQCPEERRCKLFTYNTSCSGVLLYTQYEDIVLNNQRVTSEIDCLCYLYYNNNQEKLDNCIVPVKDVDRHAVTFVKVKRLVDMFKNPVIIPIISSVFSILTCIGGIICTKLGVPGKIKKKVEGRCCPADANTHTQKENMVVELEPPAESKLNPNNLSKEPGVPSNQTDMNPKNVSPAIQAALKLEQGEATPNQVKLIEEQTIGDNETS